jgi:opacity protein-like surface antigen
MTMKHTRNLFVALGCSAAINSTLIAQDADAEAPVEAVEAATEERPLSFGLAGDFQAALAADLDGFDGDVSVLRIGGALDIGIPIDERGQLTLTLGERYSRYDFSDGSAFGGAADGEDFDLLETTIGATYFRQLNQQYSLLVLAGATFAGESGVDVDDAATFYGGVGVRYQWTEDFAITLGGIGSTEIEDDPSFFPLIAIEWQINDRLLLTTQRGASLSYQFDEAGMWTADLTVMFEGSRYRLEDDHRGRLSDGVVDDQSVPIVLGVTYRPSQTFSVRGYAGAVAWQEYTFEDSDGLRIREFETDPTAIFGLELSIDF